MASGTVKFTNDATAWVRVDDDALYVAGKVGAASSILLVYMAGKTAPATLSSDALQLEPGETFNFAMAAADSLWFRGTGGPSRLIVTKRAS